VAALQDLADRTVRRYGLVDDVEGGF